jgi:hypothetical protein
MNGYNYDGFMCSSSHRLNLHQLIVATRCRIFQRIVFLGFPLQLWRQGTIFDRDTVVRKGEFHDRDGYNYDGFMCSSSHNLNLH